MKEYVWGGSAIVLLLLMFFTITILEDRITVDLPSEQCEKGLQLIVHNDYSKLKCGNRIVAEWKEYVDYYRTYGEPDRWVNDFRKRTKIKLSVLDYSPTHFVVRKEVPYYKGRTGTDGILTIDYVFTTDKVKWSYTFEHGNTAKHRIRLKILRFEDKYGYDFIPDDDLYIGLVDGSHTYGDIKGNLFIDPMIRIATSGPNQWKFNEPFDNTTEINTTQSNGTLIYGYYRLNDFVGYDEDFSGTQNDSDWPMDLIVSGADNTYNDFSGGNKRIGSSFNCDAGPIDETMQVKFNGTETPGTSINLSNYTHIEFNASATYAESGGTSIGYIWYIFSNSTDSVTFEYQQETSLSERTYILNRTDFSNNWTIYEDGVYSTSKVLTGVLNLTFKVQTHLGSCVTTGMSYVIYLDFFNMTRIGEYPVYVESTNISLPSNFYNFTTSFNDDGDCSYSYNTNGTWISMVTGTKYLIDPTDSYLLWNATLPNSLCYIYELNLSFGETCWVESVNITPVYPYINDTLVCDYTFDDVYGSTTDTCMQELADQSSVGDGSCGLTYTGDYTCSGTFHASHQCAEFYDNDWTDYASALFGTISNGYIFINYTKPENATNATWTHASIIGNSSQDLIDCYDYDNTKLILKAHTHGDTATNKEFSAYSCMNDSGVWHLLENVTRAAGGSLRMYGSAINWTYTNSSPSERDQSNITWYFTNGTYITSGALVDEIDDTYFYQNEEIYCTVYPYDGTTYGILQQSSNNVTINYTATTNISIEGYTTPKKWESGTTPLITAWVYDSVDNVSLDFQEVCIFVGLKEYGEMVCDNETVSYNFTIPYIEEIYFNVSLESINVTGNNTYFVSLYNWSEIINATMDIESTDGVKDVTIDIGNDTVTDIILRGTTNGDDLIEDRYDDDTTTTIWQFFNNRFVTKHLNLSTIGDVQENITLTLNASAANPEGFDYEQYWVNEGDWNDTGSTNGDQPTWKFDDLQSSVSGRWNFDTSGGATSQYDAVNTRVESESAAAVSQSGSGYKEASEYSSYNSMDLDMSDTNKRWDFNYYLGVSATGNDPTLGACEGFGITRLYLSSETDGSSTVELMECKCWESGCYEDCETDCGAHPSYCSASTSGTLSLREKTNGDIEVYEDDVYKRTVTPPSGSTLEIKGYSYALADCSVDSGSGSGSASSNAYINSIDQGGFGNNYSEAGDSFSTGDFELISDTIFNTSDTTDSSKHIQSAVVTYETQEPAGCDLRVYLGANGSTDSIWQEFTSGLFTQLDTPGGNLSFKINASVSSTDDLLACALNSLDILISSDYVSNISVYWGESNVESYTYTQGDLNETNTPLTISINYSDLNEYMSDSCDDAITCLIPLKISTIQGTTGVLRIYNISVNQSLNDVSYNISAYNNSFDDCVSDPTIKCNLTNTINYSNGTITFSDLAIRLLGDGNITVNATSTNQTSGAISDSLDMLVRYTPFTLEFTQSLIEDLFFNPYSWNQKNISPYGQYITRFLNRSIQNITNDAFLHRMDLYLSTNATDSFWGSGTNSTDLYIMNQTNKHTATNISLNSTRQAFVYNATNSTETPIYILLDLYNLSDVPYFDWWNWWESYCSDEGDGYSACVVID